MFNLYNIAVVNCRKISISFILVGLTVFTFASIGGDKNKSKKNSLQSGFTPVKTNRGFTLKEGLAYRGSMILRQEKTPSSIYYSSLVTYQKGNSTYILPNKYKVSLSTDAATHKTSLQLLQLRIKLCK
ncbi:MAG: hypothetical protein ABIN89_19890 [Chitinophagaceae bacterium]